MSRVLQCCLLLAILLYIIIVFRLVVKRKITPKNSLVWLLVGVIMLVLALCPQIIYGLSSLLEIEVPTNALFAICFFLVLLMLMHFSISISEEIERNKTLTQKLAILERRVRELETRNDAMDENHVKEDI